MDMEGQSTTVPITVHVGQRATTLSYTGVVKGTYSGDSQLSATWSTSSARRSRVRR